MLEIFYSVLMFLVDDESSICQFGMFSVSYFRTSNFLLLMYDFYIVWCCRFARRDARIKNDSWGSNLLEKLT